ncbi:MAG TPA: hypothetical protein VFL86_21870 [Burkholderiaceae bacterium]|nr:hypothetical protein [Burkholderiaceae bacterium]
MKPVTSSPSRPTDFTPAPRPSAAASSARSSRLADLLGCLRIRRPPAPPTTFGDLPQEVLATIAQKLTLRPQADVADLVRAAAVNKALRSAVTSDPQTCKRLGMAPIEQGARCLIEALLSESPEPHGASLCLQVLNRLDAQQQVRLVRILTVPERRGRPTWTTHPFRALSTHLPGLVRPAQEELVRAALHHQAEEAAAQAIGGLGSGLAHLDAGSIDTLLDKAARLSDDTARSAALGGLCAGFGAMDSGQRLHLWQHVMALPARQGRALQGLGAQLKHLDATQRSQVFERTMQLPASFERAMALSGLAASMEVLEAMQKEALFTQGLSLPDGFTGERQTMVCAFAASVEHLTEGQRSQVVAEIRGLGRTSREDRGAALTALGPHFGRLAHDQQGQLLEAAADWPQHARTGAVTGLANALPHMAPAHRRVVAELALGLDLGSCAARAIGALGAHLNRLDHGLRDAIVNRALQLLGGLDSDEPMPPDDVQALAAGLGAGMEALRPEQRSAVVTTALGKRSRWHYPKLPHLAAAIGGLAAGQQHMSNADRAALVQAASQLQTDLRAAVSARELSSWQCKQALATALFGLVKA